MKYTYEDRRTFFFITRLIESLENNHKGYEEDLLRWARREGIASNLCNKEHKTQAVLRQSCAQVYKKLKKMAAVPAGQNVGFIEDNIHYLVQLFSLTELEKLILECSVLWRKSSNLRSFVSVCLGDDSLQTETLSFMLNVEEKEIEALLLAQSPLLRYGLLERWRSFSSDYGLSHQMWEFIKGKYSSGKELKNALLGRPMPSCWRARDFAYVPETELAVRLMKNASAVQGFNILLYGAPGTGKTTFAQMLASSAKRDLYPVGEEAGNDRGRNYRLQALHQKLELLCREKKSCLLFDEAEDLFSSNMTACDKVELNRLLENNICPVIWTTNNIRRMDPAFVRRFTLAVPFEQPPVQIRQKIWTQNLKKYRLPCSSAQTKKLAQEFAVAPAMIAGAARAAAIAKGNLDTVRQHMQIMTQAMRGGRKIKTEVRKEEKFNPQLVQADMDLADLTRRLKGLGRLDFSLCLYGASGTGKSAYARYLADELGLEVRQQRASDLISPFVGATEQNIARAFAQAKEEGVVLVFDEADTFLQNRAGAQHSWEISGVNEMLTWMENHPYPFVCTTNLMEALDPACLRRFSFKVKYGFLTAPQVAQAFQHFFSLEVPTGAVQTLSALTPGDFAVVKNKADILGISRSCSDIIKLLENEQDSKKRHIAKSIGFCN